MIGWRLMLVAALVLGLLATRLAADAQQLGTAPRIGFLGSTSAAASKQLLDAFREGMRELGYVEGRNIVIEYRWAEGKYGRLPDLAAELVRLKLDLLVAVSTPGAQAAKRATKTIPIVMVAIADPIAIGLVASLARPSENITGLTFISPELTGKRLELLKEVVPGLTRVAVLANPGHPGSAPQVREAQVAAQALGLQLQLWEVRDPKEFDSAFSAMTRERVGALIVLSDALFLAERRRIADLAAMHRVPAIHYVKEYADAGGLMAYGASIPDQFRRAATYVDKILMGAKPAELPVEQPTKFELVLNLKTAKALGLTIPQHVLIRADKVIE